MSQLVFEQALNGLQFSAVLFLIASGLTLIFGVMNFVNLAHGSFFMIGAYIAAWVSGLTGSFWLGVLAALPAAALIGGLLEWLVFRRLYQRDHMVQVLATGLVFFTLLVQGTTLGWLIRTLGVRPLMVAGLGLMGVCVAISAFVGQHFMHYAVALVLLGMGWNFLFVAGTTLLTTSYAPSERYRAQGLNDFVVFGTQALASLAAGPAVMRLGWPSLNLASVPLLVLMAAAVVRLGVVARAPAR